MDMVDEYIAENVDHDYLVLQLERGWNWEKSRESHHFNYRRTNVQPRLCKFA